MGAQTKLTQVDLGPAEPHQIHEYQLVRILGRGGMGVVYEAFHVRLKRRVALKLLSPQTAATPKALERFEREMAAIGQLSNPYIVQALDAGVDKNTHYLAMEYIDGENVETLAARSSPLQIADACEITRQAALGLAHAHSFGIVHRDVKPSNLLLSRTGDIKVADLGLARIAAVAEDEALTQHGAILGTYDYMSPEQAEGLAPSPASDLYSLGAMLYRLLAGRPVFAGPDFDSGARKIAGHLHTPPGSLAALRPEVPKPLEKLVRHLLEKEPRQRPTSAEEVAERLLPFCQDANLVALYTGSGSVEVSEVTTGSLNAQPTKEATHKKSIRRSTPQTSWFIFGILGAGLAISVAIVIWLSRGPDIAEQSDGQAASAGAGPDLPNEQKTIENVAWSDLELLRWYPLLNREPKKVIWPLDNLTLMNFDPTRSTLNVSCANLGILSFGRVDHTGYRLRMDLHQNQWPGEVSIVIGLRQHPDVLNGFVAQAFLFNRSSDRPAEFFLTRTRIILTPKSDGDFKVQRLDKQTREIAVPIGLPETVELEIQKQGLTRLRWGGVDNPGLYTQEINDLFEQQDYLGEFGVCLFEADLSVSSIEFMRISDRR